MLINNTIESSRKPGIPGPHRPDLKWFKDALDGKSDVGHVHKKKDIEDFEHNHDGRYYRKDEHELQLLLSGNGTPNFNQGINGDYYVDELNGDLYKKSGDAWNLIIHLEGEQGAPGKEGAPGKAGDDGYSPVKGVDYFTPDEIEDVIGEVTTRAKENLEYEFRENLKDISYDNTTGILTFTRYDGTTKDVDLPLELIVSSGTYNDTTKEIELTLANGQLIKIPLSDLIDDFYIKSEIDQKVDTINGELTNLKTEDSKLQETLTNQEKKIEELEEELETLYGDFEPNTVSGEVATITDGVDKSRVEVQGDGNSYQETRVGYNLLEPVMESATSNGVTCTNNGDGTFTLNGTPTARTTFRLDQRTGGADNLKNYDDGDYELSLGIINSNLRLVVMQNNTWASPLILPVNTEKYHAPITNATDCFIYVDVLEGATFNNVVIEPMFRKYNNDNKPFEQYGSKPSTEFPSDIEVIDMVNKVDITAKTQTLNGLTLTIQEDKSFTVTGTLLANKNANFTLGKIDYIPYFDQEMTLDIGYIPLSKNIGAMVSHAQDNNGNRIVTNFWNIDNNNNTGYATGTKKIENYDTSNGFNVLFTLYFPVVTEDTPVNISGHLQLNEGGKKPYLPYGTIGLLQTGKNRLNLNADNMNNTDIQTIVDTKKGTITINGTNTGGLKVPLSKDVLDIELNTPYTVSLELISGEVISNTNSWLFVIYPYGNSKYLQAFSTTKKTTLTWEEKSTEKPYLWLGFSSANSIGFATFKNAVYRFQIEKGDTATDYEPYKEVVHPINLNGNTLAKVGDIADLLNIGLDGSVSIEKKSNERDLTGNESYALETSDIYKRFNLGVSDIVNIQARNTNVKSNYFKSTIDNGYSVIMAYENRVLFYPTSDITTVEEFKALVKEKYDSGKPIKIMYVLKEESIETIELPSISPIKLFEGTNNFELVTNLDTTLAVNYKVSSKKQLIENNERITALEATVNTLLGGN